MDFLCDFTEGNMQLLRCLVPQSEVCAQFHQSDLSAGHMVHRHGRRRGEHRAGVLGRHWSRSFAKGTAKPGTGVWTILSSARHAWRPHPLLTNAAQTNQRTPLVKLLRCSSTWVDRWGHVSQGSRSTYGLADSEVKHDFQDIEGTLFDFLCREDGKLSLGQFLTDLKATGLRVTDPRLSETIRNFGNNLSEFEGAHNIYLDKQTFKASVAENIVLIAKAFRRHFIIPEFQRFCQHIDELYWRAKPHTTGEVASYIPQLARVNPDQWGLAVCTVDGQRYALGDATTPFCLQSASKPLTYALVLNEADPNVVHQYVGQEPSGQRFNVIGLNSQNKPHNPLINAGAIVTSSLLRPELNLADRFDYTLKMFKRLAGEEFVSFNNSVFLSERETADRNFAIAYYLKENQCFPKGTNMMEIMDFYFQMCSVEATCDSAAVIAATLANGGVCPITDDKVLEPFCIRDTLSLMLSCGMYDYSGQFAFKVGLPAKSGVSGVVMLVIPNVMGITMWSPLLDECGNSVRGLKFCKDLVETFNFHNFDNIRFTTRKMDPCMRMVETQANVVVDLLFSAYNGDVTAIRRCALSGTDMNQADYDGRTALHVAAAEGHIQVVEFLLHKCKCSPFLVDRWGFTALDDAVRFKKDKVADTLKAHMMQERPNFAFRDCINDHSEVN